MNNPNSDIVIKIADDFSDAPGARYRTDGPKSGQEFFEEILDTRFEQASQKNVPLWIDFDGTYGYATSFLSECFSRLAKKYGKTSALRTLRFISEEDPDVIEWVKDVLNEHG
jgi:hypothetical protein